MLHSTLLQAGSFADSEDMVYEIWPEDIRTYSCKIVQPFSILEKRLQARESSATHPRATMPASKISMPSPYVDVIGCMSFIHALALSSFVALECVAEGPWCNAKHWAMSLHLLSGASQAIWVADKWQISWSVLFVSKRSCQKNVDPALDWTQDAYMFFIGNAFGDFAAIGFEGGTKRGVSHGCVASAAYSYTRESH